MTLGAGCTGWDLTIRSAFRIAGAVPDPLAAHARMDVEVALGRVGPAAPMRESGPYRLTADALVFAAPGVASYRIEPPGRVIVEPCPGSSAGAVADLLIATALPALLWARGDLVLHGAAAALPNGAVIAVLGPSGAGKSWLMERLLDAGSRLIADDSIRVTGRSGRPVIAGLPGTCWRTTGAAPDAPRREIEVPADRRLARARLGGIVELVPDGPQPAMAEDAVAALATLLRHRHRPRVPTLLGRDAEVLAALARVAGCVPVHRWPVRGTDPRPDISALARYLLADYQGRTEGEQEE